MGIRRSPYKREEMELSHGHDVESFRNQQKQEYSNHLGLVLVVDDADYALHRCAIFRGRCN